MAIYSHMHCPFCQSVTDIYNSRPTNQATQTWRRHRCRGCKRTFTTRERVDYDGLVNVETATNILPYSHERLLISLLSACSYSQKALEAVPGLVGSVEQELARNGFFDGQTSSSKAIIAVATATLRRYDLAAALHYLNHVFDGNPPLDQITAIINPKHRDNN